MAFKRTTCKHCRNKLEQERAGQIVHTECAADYAIALGEKKARAEAKAVKRADAADTKARKEKLKTRADFAKEAQQAVNAYVRARDKYRGCVSCDKSANWDGQWHASHFRSVGAATAVRFNLWNIHKSCSICNNWKSGNLSEYEPRLRALIGDEKVDWLKSQNQLVRYEAEYMKRIRDLFRKRLRRLAK